MVHIILVKKSFFKNKKIISKKVNFSHYQLSFPVDLDDPIDLETRKGNL